MKAYFNDIFLTDATHGLGPRLFSALTSVSSYGINGSDSKPIITFYQGAIPTLAEMDGYLLTSRAADALLRFGNATNPLVRSGKTFTYNYTNATFGAILGSGTMTWFCTGTSANGGAAPNNSMPMLFGSVGLIESGADLELPKITVANGDLWLCTGLHFDLSNELNS